MGTGIVAQISNRQGVAPSTSASARPASGGLETRDTADKMSAPRSFRDEWQALRAKHPEVFTVSADELDAWHRHEAWRCESRKDWSNAVHHLTELLKTQPDSGDFLPRRAAACVAMADSLLSLAPGFNPVSTNGAITPAASAASRPPEAVKTAPDSAAPNTGLKPGANEKAAANTIARSAPVPGRSNADETKGVETSKPVDPANASAPEDRRTPAATSYLERALADYNRTLAWVDRYPAIAKESRKPFVEKRREVYLKLGRKAEAEADERELKLR